MNAQKINFNLACVYDADAELKSRIRKSIEQYVDLSGDAYEINLTLDGIRMGLEIVGRLSKSIEEYLDSFLPVKDEE